jgi:hypothetical protein
MNGTTALLLQAATLAPEPAFAAYQAWKQQQNFDVVSPIDLQILPRVYQNLSDLLDDDLAPRLRGIYRRAWMEQQRRITAEAALPPLPKDFVWRSHAEDDLMSTSDMLAAGSLADALAPFQTATFPGSRTKRLWHWRTQGWVQLPGTLRIFRESPESPLLHHLLGSARPVLWLARTLQDLRQVADWQHIFDEAAAYGLRRRLYHAVDWAMQSGLLEPQPLPQGFSRLDHLRFERLHTPARPKGIALAAAVGLHRMMFRSG